jgi:hypothetical protein
MHLAKGLEFKAVAVMACDDDVSPLQSRIEAASDESELDEIYDTERHLLYVACTRARDQVAVTGVEPASEFLRICGGSTDRAHLASPDVPMQVGERQVHLPHRSQGNPPPPAVFLCRASSLPRRCAGRVPLTQPRLTGSVAALCLTLALAAAPAAAQDEGDWPMPARDFAGWRYSALEQINAENVGRLAVAWTFSTGVLRGQEAAPIVAGGTMFVVTPYPNVVYALDLSQPGAPLRRKHEPKPLAAAQGVACCDVVNRGAAYAAGRVFYNTLDGQTIRRQHADRDPERDPDLLLDRDLVGRKRSRRGRRSRERSRSRPRAGAARGRRVRRRAATFDHASALDAAHRREQPDFVGRDQADEIRPLGLILENPLRLPRYR